MNPQTLREALEARLINDVVNNCTHETLAKRLDELGLADTSANGSKRIRVEAALAAFPDDKLVGIAESYLTRYKPAAPVRNRIQDLMWGKQPHPEIPKRFRRDLARALTGSLFQHSGEFLALLDRLWVLDDDPFAFFGTAHQSLRQRIERHMIRNPDDWDTETLFEELGAFTASDRRFGLFIEGLSSSEVLPDEPAQRAFVATANGVLRHSGVELVETATAGGYPVFRLVPHVQGVARKPKNLIFGSPEKPDLRLSNAVDNDIEIVSNVDKVLVYEEPIGAGGLTWSDLQAWWSKSRAITDAAEAKRTLYRRLKEALPTNSPPQRHFFEAYHRCFSRGIPSLPALLPEVWLHWDPKTVKERGADALLRFRMDFLMLFPNRVRVVLEVDGSHHYGDASGRTDPTRYANMVAADREQRLAGYEIYRFGAAELNRDKAADAVVSEFFTSLFDRHRVPYPNIRSEGAAEASA